MQARQFIDNTRYEHHANTQANFDVLNSQREAAKQRREKSVKWVTAFAVLLIFVIALGYTAIGAKITSCGYQITSLKMDIAQAENDNARLLLEVETLSSSERIQQYAKENLGMIVSDEQHVVYYEVGVEGTVLASRAMDVASSQEVIASIEVIDGETMHPILHGITKFMSQFRTTQAMASSGK